MRNLPIFVKFSKCIPRFRRLKEIRVLLSTLCQHKREQSRRASKDMYKEKWVESHCCDVKKVCKRCSKTVDKALDTITAAPKKGKSFHCHSHAIRNRVIDGVAEFYWDFVFVLD